MTVLAFDLGASSGRAVVGQLENDQLKIKEIHRFSNDPVQVGGHLYWDILRLFHEIKTGILKAHQQGYNDIESLAIDTWAVDFGLLDKNGELLGNPYHYRDHQTDGMMEEVFQHISKEDIFSRTGIQFMQINTINHLYAMQKANATQLAEAESLLMIPDLLRYFLTGIMKSEFTNATTTQLYNPRLNKWDDFLIDKLNIPKKIFIETVRPGTMVGELSTAVCEELGLADTIPVMAIGEHDTASAVAAVPTNQKHFAYLSCGTWSLLGTEVSDPVLSNQALEWNITNEGGVNDTFRLLKNIMGLWLIQECKREWEIENDFLTFAEQNDLVMDAEPFKSFVDPDHSMFINPAHMPRQVQEFCKETNQYVPQTKGEILRCVLDSLAMKYRFVLERLEQLAGVTFAELYMVGGGIKNEQLCEFTANAINRPVNAGPVEATSIGNLLTQYQGLGHIDNGAKARSIVRKSFPLKTYKPQEAEAWDRAYTTFKKLIVV